MISLWEKFRYDLPARFSGRFVSPVWDTGDVSHGVAFLPHASVWGLHGELVDLELEPIRPLRPDELAILPRANAPVCEASAGNDDVSLPIYKERHFLYLPKQVEGATIGRAVVIERYAGWLCIVGCGKVALEEVNGLDLARFNGWPG